MLDRNRIFGRIGAMALLSVIAVAGGIHAFGGHSAFAQMHGGGMHQHGDDGSGHDMATMPGLRGLDATPHESAEMAEMFRSFAQITREVTNLPDGIRTVTFSENEELMGIVASHVIGMIARVEDGRDPQVFIQSPTLDILFARRDSITTDIEMTDQGIVVIQTSDDPQVAAALQTHAAEVTDMVDRGMQAVHEAMMQRAGN